MGRLFISYSHADKEIVDKVHDFLTKHHILTWYDTASIRTGNRWKPVIEASVSSCENFLVFYSENYKASEFCKYEWDMLTKNYNNLIVVSLDNSSFSFANNETLMVQIDDKMRYNKEKDDDSLNKICNNLMREEGVIECKAIQSSEIPQDGIMLSMFLAGHPMLKHYQALSAIASLCYRLEQSELNNQFISASAGYSDISAKKKSNDIDLWLSSTSALCENNNKTIRNLFLQNLMFLFFSNSRDTGYSKDSRKLVFNSDVFTRSDNNHYRFSDYQNNEWAIDEIVSFIYEKLNERIKQIYNDLSADKYNSIAKLIEDLEDVKNASLYFERFNIDASSNQFSDFHISPFVLTIATLLFTKTTNIPSDISTSCLPTLLTPDGKKITHTNYGELLSNQNTYIYGNISGGKTSFLQYLFIHNTNCLYVDLTQLHNIKDIFEKIYNLDFTEIKRFSLCFEKTILLIDNIDYLSAEQKKEFVFQLNAYQDVFKFIIVSSKHTFEDKLCLIVDNNNFNHFCRYEFDRLNKEKIVAFIETKLTEISKNSQQTLNGDDIQKIIREFNALPEDDAFFKFFNSFTKIEILLNSISNWSEFSVTDLNKEFSTKIAVYKELLEGNDSSTYSTQKKILSLFSEIRVNISDVIKQLIDEEINSLKRFAYESSDRTLTEEQSNKLRFREQYPILDSIGERFSFVDADIKGYLSASYVMSVLQSRKSISDFSEEELLPLLDHIKNDYVVLEYLYEFDILGILGECIIGYKNESLVLILFKIAQYYPNDFYLNWMKALRTLPDKLFFGAENITSIRITPNIATIGRATFANMPILENIDFTAEGVSSVDELDIKPWAIIDCPKLSSIHLGKNYKKYHHPLFSRCDSLKEILVDDDNDTFTTLLDNQLLVSKDKEDLYCSLNSLHDELIVPDGIKRLHSNALSYLANVTSIALPASVVEMDTNFSDFCANLQSFSVNKNNKVFWSDDSKCIYTTKQLENGESRTVLFRVPSGLKGEFTISDNVNIIGSDSISCCSQLTQITIPNSVNKLENYAFADTYSLQLLIISDITAIDSGDSYIFLSTNESLKIQLGARNGIKYSLTDFNSKYLAKRGQALSFALNKPITIETFTNEGFELAHAGTIRQTPFNNASIVRDIVLFNPTYNADDFNLLIIGLTEYNAIVKKTPLDAEKYVRELLHNCNISMIAVSRDLPLLDVLETDLCENIPIIRSSKSSTSLTNQLSELMKKMGETK